MFDPKSSVRILFYIYLINIINSTVKKQFDIGLFHFFYNTQPK